MWPSEWWALALVTAAVGITLFTSWHDAATKDPVMLALLCGFAAGGALLLTELPLPSVSLRLTATLVAALVARAVSKRRGWHFDYIFTASAFVAAITGLSAAPRVVFYGIDWLLPGGRPYAL